MLVGKVLQPPILLLALSCTFSSSQKSGGREKWLEYLNGSEKALVQVQFSNKTTVCFHKLKLVRAINTNGLVYLHEYVLGWPQYPHGAR